MEQNNASVGKIEMKEIVGRVPVVVVEQALDDVVAKALAEYPDLNIGYRSVSDKKKGGVFAIDWDGERSMVLDVRSMSKTDEKGRMRADEAFIIFVEFFHEMGHLEQYASVFYKDDEASRRLALATLFGRYFPEYKDVFYDANPAEMSVERMGLISAKSVFDETLLDYVEFDGIENKDAALKARVYEEFLSQTMHKLSPWSACGRFGSFQSGLDVMQAAIDRPNEEYPPEFKCIEARVTNKRFPFLPIRESKMRRDIKSDPNLFAAFMKTKEEGGSRASQWAVMEQYVRDHPVRNLKLFPNLAYLVPDGVDLDTLPTLAEINKGVPDDDGSRREAMFDSDEELVPVDPFGGKSTGYGDMLNAKLESERRRRMVVGRGQLSGGDEHIVVSVKDKVHEKDNGLDGPG